LECLTKIYRDMEKVFEFNNEGEKDWVAADLMKQAREFYSDLVGQPESDLDEFWVVKELTTYEIERNIVIDFDGYHEDENGVPKNDGVEFSDGFRILGSMKEIAERLSSPDIIACNHE